MSPRALSKHEGGAIFVEHLIAYLPVLFFFLATWQLLELCAARLIVQRAASAAARAAIVVLPDDPAFYEGGGSEPAGNFSASVDGSAYQNQGNPSGYNERDEATGKYKVAPGEPERDLAARGQKGVEVTLAAAMILAASPHLGPPRVMVSGGGGSSLLSATVDSDFECFAGWVSLICGVSGKRNLKATATHVYQGARYSYQP